MTKLLSKMGYLCIPGKPHPYRVKIFLFSTMFPLFTYWGPASQEPWDNNIPWPSSQIGWSLHTKLVLHVRLNSVLYSVHVIVWNGIRFKTEY